MALGILQIVFTLMAAVTVLGIALLFLVQNKKIKSFLFYLMVFWGLLIAFLCAASLPENYTIQRWAAWLTGALPIAALVLRLKKPEYGRAASLIVSVSVILGMLQLYYI